MNATQLCDTRVTIEPIKPLIGGIVHVTKDHLCDDEVIQACRDALEDRGVLVFPRIHLTDVEQLAFTDKLGKRANFAETALGAADQVYKVTLDKKFNPQPEYVLGTWFWHMDGVTVDQPLPKATMLSARKVAPEGGQTEFASTVAAYDSLADAEKEAIRALKVVHRMEAAMRPVFREISEQDMARYRTIGVEMVHPLVWTRLSGRKSLVIGTTADEVVGRSIAAGRSLLARLVEWAAQPEFTYRHEWEEGDCVIWNNCGVLHRVVPYDESCGRTMHRTTIMGDERLGHPLRQVELQ